MTTEDNGPGHTSGRGGSTSKGYLYELTGGELCLDFANTVDSRPTDAPRELLNDYEDLVQWSVQSDAITPSVAKRLRRAAATRSRKTAAVLRQARALREAIFELCSASARGVSPPVAALGVLNESLPTVFEHLRLVGNKSEYNWEWEDKDAPDCMLWPIVRSAVDLLTSDRLDRLRVCAAENCDWLFLDQSKNHSRRWCDMTVCGNRDKVRRYRRAEQGS